MMKTTSPTIAKIFTGLFLIVFLCISNVEDINAQRTSSRRTTTKREASRAKEDDSKLAEQWLAIHLGNVQFGNGFSLSTKFSYGFEFEKRFSVGAYGKVFYDFINRFSPTPDISLFSYGAGAFARVKIVEEFYLVGEYGYTSFDQSFNPRVNIWSPSVGAGYKSGFGDWTYGLHILFPLDEFARDYLNLEYWIDFNYKF